MELHKGGIQVPKVIKVGLKVPKGGMEMPKVLKVGLKAPKLSNQSPQRPQFPPGSSSMTSPPCPHPRPERRGQ